MKLRHFETLRPICPVCRIPAAAAVAPVEFPLRIGTIIREDRDAILEGVLLCTNAVCQREYPILDGVPLLIRDLRSYVEHSLFALTSRDDLSPVLESLLIDAGGPGSVWDLTRQHLSTYVWDHYGEFDPLEVPATTTSPAPQPGAVVRLLDALLQSARSFTKGPVLDLGCGVGRTTLQLAKQTSELVLGIDLNFSLARVGASILQTGRVDYARRRVGLVYDRRTFDVPFASAENADFWVCDIAALPFADHTFGTVAALNVLDCVPSPRELLLTLSLALRSGGTALLACPYDWSPAATPAGAWLGGHSQRGETAGDSARILRELLTPGAHPAGVDGLVCEQELDHLPWHVRLHDRSTVLYRVHALIARAMAEIRS